jgi:hypothetical protein
MMDADLLLQRLERMSEAIPKYAKAKANRVYIENFLRSKKSILMGECDEKATNAKERYAYANSAYIELLNGLKEAIEIEETHKWALERLKMEVDVWRTIAANERFLKDKL